MQEVTFSAPGSLMLLGEHAVLDGNTSLVCAINKRIFVSIYPITNSKKVIIDSNLGYYNSEIDILNEDSRFTFILEVIRSFINQLDSGIHIKIESEFSSTVGFGSSAAVTVATYAAFYKYVHGYTPNPLNVYKAVIQIIRSLQEWGSGADIAASIYGGLISYSNCSNSFPINNNLEEPSINKLDNSFPIVAIYCGYKKPTNEVIKDVLLDLYNSDKGQLRDVFFNEINLCAIEGIEAIGKNNLDALGLVMNTQQYTMDAMGLNTPELEEICEILQKDPDIYGAKISGSGLGDCIVAIGETSSWEKELNNLSIMYEKYPLYELKIEPNGFLQE